MDQRARIREEIDETRVALADKLRIMDERARNRFSDARTRAKNAVTVRHQVKQHPFVVLGLALGAGAMAVGFGYAVNRILRGGGGDRVRPARRVREMTMPMRGERGVLPPEPWLMERRRRRPYRQAYLY